MRAQAPQVADAGVVCAGFNRLLVAWNAHTGSGYRAPAGKRPGTLLPCLASRYVSPGNSPGGGVVEHLNVTDRMPVGIPRIRRRGKKVAGRALVRSGITNSRPLWSGAHGVAWRMCR